VDASRCYTETAISTQERGKLVVMLYQGAISYLRTARQKLQAGDYAGKGIYIGKAQEIVAELNNSLNVEADREIAMNLRSLYNYMYRGLSRANVERDPAKISECIKLLSELLEAWQVGASRPPGLNAEGTEGLSGLET